MRSQHTASECGRDTRGVLKEEEDTHLVGQISHGGQWVAVSQPGHLCSHTSLQFISHASASTVFKTHSLVSFGAPERLPAACKGISQTSPATSATSPSVPSFAFTKLLTELCSAVFYCVPSHQADFCLRVRCSLPHQSSSLLGDPLYHCPMYLAVSRCWELCSRSTFLEGLHYPQDIWGET